MSYKSPISILYDDDFMLKVASQLQEHNEMHIMAQINQHVSVDKEELIKALNYDRQQYEEGYADAKAEYQRPQGKWEYNQYDGNPNIGNWHCSNCHNICYEMKLAHDNYNFCPNCGADMRGAE